MRYTLAGKSHSIYRKEDVTRKPTPVENFRLSLNRGLASQQSIAELLALPTRIASIQTFRVLCRPPTVGCFCITIKLL